MSREEAARTALAHTLRRIKEDPELAWHFVGTESHHLMVVALGLLTGEAPERVAETYNPPETRDPRTITPDHLPKGYKLVEKHDLEAEQATVEWPARDHETFYWPVHLLNEALAAMRCGVQLSLERGRPGYYELTIHRRKGVCYESE